MLEGREGGRSSPSEISSSGTHQILSSFLNLTHISGSITWAKTLSDM